MLQSCILDESNLVDRGKSTPASSKRIENNMRGCLSLHACSFSVADIPTKR